MPKPKANYFCEACGNQVDKWDVRCPHCGKQFDPIKCPQCDYSGNAQEFSNGCPSCGFMSEEQKKAAADRNRAAQSKIRSISLPSPQSVSVGGRILLVTVLSGIIAGLAYWITRLSV